MKNTVIIRPIITEKSMRDVQKGIFSFVVTRRATKADIRAEVEKAFNVNVVSVATSVLKGGTVRTGMKRIEVKNQPTKKAYVQLRQGQKISAFEL